MKLFSLMIMTIAVLLTTSCSYKGQSTTQLANNFIYNQSVTPITHENYPPKNPNKVTLYSQKQAPLTPYRIIASVKVSKYTLLGSYRQHETLNTMMKNLAASLGGDGVININHSPEHVQAQVIQFQRILI